MAKKNMALASAVNLSYDLDGNLLSYNGWGYQWNGENRLILASNATHTVAYFYDHRGRMVLKTTTDNALGVTDQTDIVGRSKIKPV